jgi:integrase
MPLTDTAIRNAKPGAKPIKLFDGGGLYLELSPAGGRWWRLKYRHGGKELRISLGVYPDVTLRTARERRDEARRLLAEGIDPGALRKTAKARSAEAAANTFEAVAREWHAKHSPNWAESHSSKIITRFEADAFPWIGARPIEELTAPEILRTLRRIEERGALDTAHRVLQTSSQVFRYAIATGRAHRDPCADLRGALPPAKGDHYAAITDPSEVGALLRAIDGYAGDYVTRHALRLAPLLFVRPGELRHAEWSEINFDKAEWRIPAAKMKMRAEHIVPLSTQAIETLRELQSLTGSDSYVFPSLRSRGRPMSENTVNAALRRMGYTTEQMTGHGFRSMASTILNEQGWNRDVIERQLAHVERNAVRAAYNRAEHLPERRKMMQAWADYLDSLKRGGSKVVAIKAA